MQSNKAKPANISMDFFVQKKVLSHYKKIRFLTKADARASNQRFLPIQSQGHRPPPALTCYSDVGVPRLTRLHQTSREGRPGLPDRAGARLQQTPCLLRLRT
jgi:hypothetical protein